MLNLFNYSEVLYIMNFHNTYLYCSYAYTFSKSGEFCTKKYYFLINIDAFPHISRLEIDKMQVDIKVKSIINLGGFPIIAIKYWIISKLVYSVFTYMIGRFTIMQKKDR